MTAAFVAATLATVGMLTLRRAVAPRCPPLAVELARLLEPAPTLSVELSQQQRLVSRLIAESERSGPRWDRVRGDLAVTGDTLDTHLLRTAGYALALGAAALLLTLGLAIQGLGIPLPVVALAAIVAVVAGAALPTTLARQAATERREQVRAALPGYLDLVGVLLAAGESLDSALRHAATLADSWPYAQLRAALDRAAVARRRPSDELAALGTVLGVDELVEVADSFAMASHEGTAIRASLAARARGLREHQLASAETAAGRATEGMSFPLVAFVVGFVLLIGYPAVVGLSSGLGSG